MRALLCVLLLAHAAAAGAATEKPASIAPKPGATAEQNAAPAEKNAPAPKRARSARALPVRPGADTAKLALETGHGRPAVLHFWATWCSACEQEFPRLRPLLNGLEKRGVGVLLVSIDEAKTRARAPAMLARFGLSRLPALVLDAPDPAPVVLGLDEPQWDGTLPATFVFDAKGKKVKAFLGQADPALLAAAIERARSH